MRFDLTQAAFRIFDRASRLRIDGRGAISAAKILIALFEEEETRAADWLTEAELSLEAFHTAFGLGGETASDQATYSIRSDQSAESGDTKRSEPTLFFLDDQQVRVGRLSKELESTLWTLPHRLGQRPVGEIRTKPNFRLGLPSFTLATEHLLLAATLDEGEVGRWLHDNGLEPTELLTKIEELSSDKNHEPDFESTATSEPTATVGRSSLGLPLSRLLDAVSNRASEALRVIEDYVRFVLDDKALTSQLKEFRHELRRLVQPFSNLSARDTEQDVGTELEGDGEYERRETSDVLAANFGRLQESLRSLEEFSKLETPQSAKEFERLRYRSYTLHKEVLKVGHIGMVGRLPPGGDVRYSAQKGGGQPTLEAAKLYALTDVGTDETEFREKIRQLIADGADVIQLRDKTADDRTLLERAKILRELTSESSVLFVMNDRPDLARLATADGVHVGQEELSVKDVRRIVGDEMLIGVSTHDIDQVRAAVRDGADYLGAGPVFPSTTKEFETYLGLEFLRAVAAEIQIPVFAIGGIDADNLPQVLETGITRIAVAGAASQLAMLKNVL